MMLKNYYNKKVEIIDDEGLMYTGIVSDYFYPEDNPNGKESIVLDAYSKGPIEFYEKDIRSIIIL